MRANGASAAAGAAAGQAGPEPGLFFAPADAGAGPPAGAADAGAGPADAEAGPPAASADPEPGLSAASADADAAVGERPQPAHGEPRLWLRLLTCTTMIETEIRRRLRKTFATTLPRFDLLAQLDRAPEGMIMGELSRRMMVSNGNVTGLVELLVQEKLVERHDSETDRRATRVRLSERGRAEFAIMAAAHSAWIAELVAGLAPHGQDMLWARLGDLKRAVRATTAVSPHAAAAPAAATLSNDAAPTNVAAPAKTARRHVTAVSPTTACQSDATRDNAAALRRFAVRANAAKP